VKERLLLYGIDGSGHRAPIYQGVEDAVLVLAHAAKAGLTRSDAAVMGAKKTVDRGTASPLLP
jgi:hypothetical protein